MLFQRGIIPIGLSRWYRSSPVPFSDQPRYVNAVAEISTGLPPDELLASLHAVEDALGRQRSQPNAARLIDLDLIDYRGKIAAAAPGRATLPHPRLAGRAFVLKPLADLDPEWRHPDTGTQVAELLSDLPRDQIIEPMDPQPVLVF